MKTKIFLLGFCLMFSLTNANAEFEPVNQNNKKYKFLIFLDFGNAKAIPNSTSQQFKIPAKTNSIDEEFHQILEKSLLLPDNFSKIWLVGKIIIDCDKQEITPTWQLMGTPKKTNSSPINISQKYHFDLTNSTQRDIDFTDKTDNLIFHKACKSNPTLKK